MNRKGPRYIIQLGYINQGFPIEWKHFYSAKSSRTLRAARKELREWWNKEWDFTYDNNNALFRIYDTKKGRPLGL